MNSIYHPSCPDSQHSERLVQQSRLRHLRFMQDMLAALLLVSSVTTAREPRAAQVSDVSQVTLVPESPSLAPQTVTIPPVVCKITPLVNPSIPLVIALQPTAPEVAKTDSLFYQAPIETQGLECIKGNVLIIADVENLSYGLRHEAREFDFNRFLHYVRARAQNVHAHAFATTVNPESREQSAAYFHRWGWEPHLYQSTIKHTRTGRLVHQANSDNQILLGAGSLAETTQADLVVLATGDGDLACSLAGFFKSRPQPPLVATASLAGATSRRLYASVNPHINSNIVLGRDCMLH